jgi:radical SAM protein with 4Fe4S-binding SPASM domain
MNKLNHFIYSCTRAYEKKCAYSLGDGKPLANELTTNEAKTLIEKAADFGVDYFFISGAGCTGEPLIRKDLVELIHYASEYHLAPSLKSSGYRFTTKVAKELAASDGNATISLAGLKETDYLLRGKGAYEETIEATKLCVAHGVPFSLHVLNTKYVVNQVHDLVMLSLDLGANAFYLASLIPQPICVEDQLRILGPLEPTPLQREKQLMEIYTLNKELGEQIRIIPYEMFYNRILKTKDPTLDLHSGCSMCDNLVKNEWLEILDDGKAYSCSPLGLTYGDIRKDSIQEIMGRMRPSELVEKLADHKNLKGKCGICEYSNICGGCRGRAYIYSGDMFNPDPMCAYIPKKNKR